MKCPARPADSVALERDARRCGARGSLAITLCLFALARGAAAEEPSEAEALFKQGLDAMRARNYHEACPKLSESYRLDPLPGALFTLAECEAADGKSATAIEHYQNFVNGLTALPPDRRDAFEERRRLAIDKITALSVLAPEITVDVSGSAPQNLVVKRNDVVIEPSAYGVGKRVDQGDYVVSAELDGKRVWAKSFKLEERDRARVEVPWPVPKAKQEEPAPLPKQPEPVVAQRSKTGSGGMRTWMYVTGGIGAAGLATGLVAGAVALSKKGTINDNCPNRTCNAEGRDAVNSGQSAALVSSIGFAVGLAGAGATAALFFLTRSEAPKDQSRAHRFRPVVAGSRDGAAFGLRGVF